jgi:HD-like signal output (HDOD) protein
MSLGRNRVRIVPYVGESDALRFHSRRVACWSVELAERAGLSLHSRTILWQAALQHHVPPLLVNEGGRARLLEDLGIAESDTGEGAALDGEVREVLAAFHRRSEQPVSPEIQHLASILEEGNILDEAFETDSWNPGEFEHDPWVKEILSKLRILPDDANHYVTQHLPLLPPAAEDAISTFDSDVVPLESLSRIAQTDGELAGFLIRAANSSANAALAPIATVEHAITHLGLQTARNFLLAASLRPLFDRKSLRRLWNHSLDAAQIAEELATIGDCYAPSAAFLAGLVHDIGRTVMLQLPAGFQIRYGRLVEQGCPMHETETVLAGFTHADCGAAILQAWQFPHPISQAVLHHHRLADPSSVLPALLYLAEFWCAEEEDLPSSIRLHAALSACGLDKNTILGTEIPSGSPMQVLRFETPSE